MILEAQSHHDVKVGDKVMVNPFFKFGEDDVKFQNGSRVGTYENMSAEKYPKEYVVTSVSDYGAIHLKNNQWVYARNQLLVSGVDYVREGSTN